MRIALLVFCLLIWCVGVHAEDFSGFYAGVSAGHGFGHDADNQIGPGTPPGGGETATPDRGLPPSAASASQALQDARPRANLRSR